MTTMMNILSLVILASTATSISSLVLGQDNYMDIDFEFNHSIPSIKTKPPEFYKELEYTPPITPTFVFPREEDVHGVHEETFPRIISWGEFRDLDMVEQEDNHDEPYEPDEPMPSSPVPPATPETHESLNKMGVAKGLPKTIRKERHDDNAPSSSSSPLPFISNAEVFRIFQQHFLYADRLMISLHEYHSSLGWVFLRSPSLMKHVNAQGLVTSEFFESFRTCMESQLFRDRIDIDSDILEKDMKMGRNTKAEDSEGEDFDVDNGDEGYTIQFDIRWEKNITGEMRTDAMVVPLVAFKIGASIKEFKTKVIGLALDIVNGVGGVNERVENNNIVVPWRDYAKFDLELTGAEDVKGFHGGKEEEEEEEDVDRMTRVILTFRKRNAGRLEQTCWKLYCQREIRAQSSFSTQSIPGSTHVFSRPKLVKQGTLDGRLVGVRSFQPSDFIAQDFMPHGPMWVENIVVLNGVEGNNTRGPAISMPLIKKVMDRYIGVDALRDLDDGLASRMNVKRRQSVRQSVNKIVRKAVGERGATMTASERGHILVIQALRRAFPGLIENELVRRVLFGCCS